MPASVFDENANVEAIALYWDVCAEMWKLQSIGSLEEVRESCRRTRSKGFEGRLMVYVVSESFGEEIH
jgi:hypothetical protein